MLSPAPMSFKPNPAPGSCPALPGFGLLRVEGRDAAAFLQAQSMNDVAGLAPGHWHWNGLLTPKGRVIALFALLRESDGQFLLALPDFTAGDMAVHLQKFVFRSKVGLVPLEDWRACAGPPAQTPGLSAAAGDADGGWVLDVSGEASPRHLWLLPAAHPAVAAASASATAAWRQADLAHGLPRLPAGQRETWTPQMLSLARLSAYSLKKGCYPGQEIVSRTHYLGQAKRILARFRADPAPAVGSPVLAPGERELGSIVCTQDDQALAVVAAEPGSDELVAGGRPLARLELLGGLAR